MILGREAVPERWQEKANVQELYRLMKRYLDDPQYTESVRADLRSIRSQLGDRGATQRVADSLKKYFDESPNQINPEAQR